MQLLLLKSNVVIGWHPVCVVNIELEDVMGVVAGSSLELDVEVMMRYESEGVVDVVLEFAPELIENEEVDDEVDEEVDEEVVDEELVSDDTDVIDELELVIVVESTELNEGIVRVVVKEVDAVIDDDDVVLEKARGAKNPKIIQLQVVATYGYFTNQVELQRLNSRRQ